MRNLILLIVKNIDDNNNITMLRTIYESIAIYNSTSQPHSLDDP